MRRLYYIADDLQTTQALSDALHAEGISDWNFHVVARDEQGLYRHHIHSASPIQRRDVVHSGERWALAGAIMGGLVGTADYFWGFSGVGTSLPGVLIWVLGSCVLGGWSGCLLGFARENYKLEPYHAEIEAGRYLIMVDVHKHSRNRVGEIMNMGFPRVRHCGTDSTIANPFRSPERVYPG